MEDFTLTIGQANFEVNNVTAQRTSMYGHYKVSADVDGVTYSCISTSSQDYDALYRETYTEEDIEEQEDAMRSFAKAVIYANDLA